MTTEELAKETMTELNALVRMGMTAPEQDYAREVGRLSLILTLLAVAEAASVVVEDVNVDQFVGNYIVDEDKMKDLINCVKSLEELNEQEETT